MSSKPLEAPALVLPPKLETEAVRKGRALCQRIEEGFLELRSQGEGLRRILINRQAEEHMKAFFEFASSQWDGSIPRVIRGAPLIVVAAGSYLEVDVVGKDEMAERRAKAEQAKAAAAATAPVFTPDLLR